MTAPLVEIECITRRQDAVYHDYASGLTDMLVPDNMAMEGKLYSLVKAVAPALVNVHVPTEGRRFHAYLQFKNPGPGEVRDALLAAMAYRRVKTVIAVEEDVDLFSPDAMLWALATRVLWSRDVITVEGLSGSSLDPVLPEGVSTTAKVGIDATRTPGYPVVATVPDEVRRKVADWLSGGDSSRWPTI